MIRKNKAIREGRMAQHLYTVEQASELLELHVYDLYYKKRATMDSWWKVVDSRGGSITVGMEHEFT